MKQIKIKKDKYLKARQDKYKVYEIFCRNCNSYILHYQKDGDGILKRLYLDRINCLNNFTYEGVCWNCGTLFGSIYIYKKEKRPAIRLFVGAIKKREVDV